jgi:hypothetical protein
MEMIALDFGSVSGIGEKNLIKKSAFFRGDKEKLIGHDQFYLFLKSK